MTSIPVITSIKFRGYTIRQAEVEGTNLFYYKDISELIMEAKDTIGFRDLVGTLDVQKIRLNRNGTHFTRGLPLAEVDRAMATVGYDHRADFMRMFTEPEPRTVSLPAVVENGRDQHFMISINSTLKGRSFANVKAPNYRAALAKLESLPPGAYSWVVSKMPEAGVLITPDDVHVIAEGQVYA